MTRIVFDTNVVISAAIQPNGTPAQLLQLVVEGRLHLLTSEPLLSELNRALHYPKVLNLLHRRGWTADDVLDFLAAYRRFTDVTAGQRLVQGVLQDQDDEMVLSCAIEATAELLVTGDRELLDLATYEGIRIISPAQAFADLSGAQ